MKSIGVMSGTSCDGVDAVVLELTSAEDPGPCEIRAHHFVPFPEGLQGELIEPTKLSVPRLAELHFELANYYRQAVQGLSGWESASCCGLHGQTVWHQPNGQLPTTFQIGSSAALAEALRKPVVADLRSADLVRGGQGAPIVPFAHWFFLCKKSTPTLVVNLGGICNMTWVTPKVNDVVAYDVGPGMLISNAFARLTTDGKHLFDQDGALSHGGRLIKPLLQSMQGHPFISKKPPKSTGREDFGATYYEELFAKFRGHYPDADISYTLLAATAEILHAAAISDNRINALSYDVVLTGGGAMNPVLVAEMRRVFAKHNVLVAADGVLAPQHHEPAAVALIAARTMKNLPSSIPNVTGARRSAVLGHIHQPG